MSENDKTPEPLEITMTFGDDSKPFKGWVELSKEEVVSTKAPWRKGSLIQIHKSPAPGKIPDNSVAMLLDYNFVKYKVTPPKPGPIFKSENEPIAEDGHYKTLEEKDYFQHKLTVLFQERIVDLYSQELGEHFDEADENKIY